MSDSSMKYELQTRLACPVCGGSQCDAFNPQSLLFPSVSASKLLPGHRNHLCKVCGTVFMFPLPPRDLLIRHYKEAYRKSEYAIEVDGRQFDLPIQFPESATSFSRFRNFISCVDSLKNSIANVVPDANDLMIDIGGYQGMFLHAAKQVYGVEGIVVDFNEKGIQFARTALGFEDSQVIDNVYGYTPRMKARFVSMVHSLEHVEDPVRLLRHVKAQVLQENGLLYLEVPNLFGSPLNDPVHFFTFSPDSLSYMLNASGYEVVHISTAGNPHAPTTIANDELVLVCMARSVANPPIPQPIADQDVAMRVKRNYGRLSRKAIVGQVRRTFSELTKLVYYSVGHFLLEKVSKDIYGAINRLKKITGLRIH